MRKVLKIILITTVILGLLVSGISCSQPSTQTPETPPTTQTPVQPIPTPTPTPTEKPIPTTSAPAPTPMPTPEYKREVYETSVPFNYAVNSYGDEAWYEDESNKGKKAPDLWYEWVNVKNLDSEGGVFTITFLVRFGDISKKYSTSEFVSYGETKKITSEGHKQIATGGFTFSVTPPTKTVIAYRDVPSDSTPAPTPTTESVPIDKNDFLITIVPNRQATLTNNSQSTVQVYKSSITYECYSYVEYNMPGKPSPYYGPIIRPVSTSDESTQLKPGQSFTKAISCPTDVLSVLSCSFWVRDNSTGQTLAVTSP